MAHQIGQKGNNMSEIDRKTEIEILAVDTIRSATEDVVDKCISELFSTLIDEVKNNKEDIPIATCIICGKPEDDKAMTFSLKFCCNDVGEALILNSGMSEALTACFNSEMDKIHERMHKYIYSHETVN